VMTVPFSEVLDACRNGRAVPPRLTPHQSTGPSPQGTMRAGCSPSIPLGRIWSVCVGSAATSPRS
jgi:hypothetical protein